MVKFDGLVREGHIASRGDTTAYDIAICDRYPSENDENLGSSAAAHAPAFATGPRRQAASAHPLHGKDRR